MKLFHRRYSVGTCRPYSINVLHPGEESSQSVHLPLWPSGLSSRKLCRINSQWEDSLSKLHVGMSKWRSHRWSMRRGCTGVEGCFLPQGPAPFPGAIVLPVLLTGVPCILPVLVVPRLLLESGFYYPRLQLCSHCVGWRAFCLFLHTIVSQRLSFCRILSHVLETWFILPVDLVHLITHCCSWPRGSGAADLHTYIVE